MAVDPLDHGIIELYTREPSTSVVQAARTLGVARPTVQARLQRLVASGALVGILPVLDPAHFGFPITAMCRVLIDQRAGHDSFMADLARIPEVLDLYTVTGDFDVSMRIVARSNQDLQRVFDEIASIPSVTRTTSAIVMTSHLQNRTLDLFRKACGVDDAAVGSPDDADRVASPDGEAPRDGLDDADADGAAQPAGASAPPRRGK